MLDDPFLCLSNPGMWFDFLYMTCGDVEYVYMFYGWILGYMDFMLVLDCVWGPMEIDIFALF